ncbi:hypothetical protein EV702DRAFT_1060533 [Suillus placidus]|uniref:Uncharacterized protein n=1 Tax=Suillus placidus TaxID=48579 RepID=A0A9P7D8B3_9AGAM|nr:hypothetical protein EV702DRAFT_1060533 [Suillus placidus]
MNLSVVTCNVSSCGLVINKKTDREPWIATITDFERRSDLLKVRSRVKAARDLRDVAEGLHIVAATKLQTFFLALLQLIRTSVTTNMQVMQTSIFVKYQSIICIPPMAGAERCWRGSKGLH